MGAEGVDHPPHAGAFLPDRDIHADDVAGLLADDRVDRDGCLADGAVTDDQLALAAPKGEQRVDDQEAGLHRFRHQVAVDDGGGGTLDRVPAFRRDRAFPVQRPAQRIDHAAEQARADGHSDHVPGAPHRLAGLDRIDFVQQDASDVIAGQGPGEAELALFEPDQFVEADIGEPRHQRDAVADLFDAADLVGPGAEDDSVEPDARALQPQLARVGGEAVRRRHASILAGCDPGRRAGCC